MRFRLFCLALALCCAGTSFSQTPPARDKASATIGGKTISIEYGRPALKGRSFDDLMKQLPADRIWRAGSNMVTLFSTEIPLTIEGKTIPAGKYSLYVHCPIQGDFSLVINKDLGQPLSKVWSAAPPSQANEPYPHFEYQKEIGNLEIARVPMKKASLPATDVFTIALKPSASGADMLMSWGDRSWTLNLVASK
jgi:hypothetical protein